MKKILIIGASGLIGRHLYKVLSKKNFVIGTANKKKKSLVYLDLSDNINEWPQITALDVIILCGGITNIFNCEKNKKYSRLVNINGLKKIKIGRAHV